jgi:sigma-B regulation protein RsbU (phosphoserine phosphatase)
VSKDAFETGFIILAIIAFQPILNRIEELLGSILLKGRVDTARKFKRLSDDVSGAAEVDELERILNTGFRDILDTSVVSLRLCGDASDNVRLRATLEAIGEPVKRLDLANFERVGDDYTTFRGLGQKIVQRKGGHRSLLEEILDESPRVAGYDVIVPVIKEKKCVGYIGLGEKIYGVPYSSEEMAHLSVLATQVASALQNIRLMKENLERKLFEEELKIARKIQTQLLPGDPPRLTGFDLCALTLPSRYVGGDYYDFVVLDNRWLALVVADVSGKGIPASILTATLQAAVRSNVDAQTDPGLMMERLNRLLYQNTSASEFATLFYCVVDLHNATLRYANAGHDFPFVIDNSGAESLGESGIVLGCLEEFSYATSEFQIPENGTLVLYTDGVTESESEDGDYFGEGRLRDTLKRHAGGSAEAICGGVINDIHSFSNSEAQDDITLVVLKRTGRA